MSGTQVGRTLITGLAGLYISNSGPIAEIMAHWTKIKGRRYSPAPRTTNCYINSYQLPQSRAVSLVMVQLAPSEQLTTWYEKQPS